MAAAIAAISIKQQCAEANINSYVRFNDSCIAILYAARNIVRKIGAIKEVEINPEIFIGGQIILEEHSESDRAICGTAQPTTFNRCAVYRLKKRIECIYFIKITFDIFFCIHQPDAD